MDAPRKNFYFFNTHGVIRIHKWYNHTWFTVHASNLDDSYGAEIIAHAKLVLLAWNKHNSQLYVCMYRDVRFLIRYIFNASIYKKRLRQNHLTTPFILLYAYAISIYIS